jgi:hypothetical protein
MCLTVSTQWHSAYLCLGLLIPQPCLGLQTSQDNVM